MYIRDSSEPNLGTKGIQLPLADLLLPYIPEDYDIVVLSCAYGAVSYTHLDVYKRQIEEKFSSKKSVKASEILLKHYVNGFSEKIIQVATHAKVVGERWHLEPLTTAEFTLDDTFNGHTAVSYTHLISASSVPLCGKTDQRNHLQQTETEMVWGQAQVSPSSRSIQFPSS